MTPRQTQILALLAEGMTQKEVAVSLGVSRWTVKRHMAEAYERLGVQTATPWHSTLEAFRVLGWLRGPA